MLAAVNLPTLDGMTSGPSSTLDGVVPAIEQLERALGEERIRLAAILRALVGDERLQRLERLAAQRRSEFDGLDFIGESRLGSGQSLWGWEEFHSDVLALLLNPKERHGLGDSFLRALLRRIGISPDIGAVDLSAAEVVREWEHEVDGQTGYLDILVVDRDAQILCAIENKTFSSEHDEQLTRYRIALDVAYPAFAKCHAFLTPQGTDPLREKERGHWTALPYSAVFEIVQQMAADGENPMTPDVRAFMRLYATTLRRNLVPDTSVSQLARRIYLEHREAVELLLENRPDWAAELKPAFKKAIERQPDWRLDHEINNAVRFRANVWDRYEVTRTGSGWENDSDALVLFEFVIQGGQPLFQVWMTPANEDNQKFRKCLFEAVKQRPSLFNPRESSFRDSWIVLHRDEDYMLEENDLGLGWDNGTTRAKLESWVADFTATRLPRMNQVIVDCLEEYEAEGES